MASLSRDEILVRLHEGARTIEQMAPFMEELKVKAIELRTISNVENQGFFRPEDEMRTRQIHASYWQTRAAFFDLIESVRLSFDKRTDLAFPAFLIAYAAALLMIDAARFLRDNFDSIPVIVTKLNHADPAFGIPKQTYNTVQKSLTDPGNAIQLFFANQFWERHSGGLEKFCEIEKKYRPCYDTICALENKIKVRARDYAKARVKLRAKEAFSDLQDLAVDHIIYGLQEFLSLTASSISTSPRHVPALPKDIQDAFNEILQPGDILVTRKNHALTNYFLPGFWPHALLYVGTPDQLNGLQKNTQEILADNWDCFFELGQRSTGRVLESLKDGVRLRTTSSPFASDALAVIRPQLNESGIAEALKRGIEHEGKPYDFDFDFTRSNRLVCTEVIYRSYDGIHNIEFPLSKRAGRLCLSAEDLLQMAVDQNHFKTVAVYLPDQDEIARDDLAVNRLRETMTENQVAASNT
ncbi:MAG: hypothetical protein JKX97_04730 [Candidatus Lindowbacteria bacterium]|nr:hypothetical protein [Candidatus Lindowbacteria bacterium]